MPNRILKESITTSNEVNNLSAEEERFFYRLIVVCDDFGRMDARPPILRARCFPLKLDSVKDKDIEKWLNSLVEQRLIFLYETDGKSFLQMVTWHKHQQKRAKNSKYPAPEEGKITSDITCDQMISDASEKREYEKRESRNENAEPKKINYAEFVKMTEVEYQKLIEKHGQSATNKMIEILDNYKGAKGKTYKNDYRAILNWVVRRYQEEKGGPRSGQARNYNPKPGYRPSEQDWDAEPEGRI